ncbi:MULTISPECIES: TetR/AcrR family transcriptional regulator [unclassified Duganella]|jgi:TetR/AcrR family transcriptional repressor of nem operon|uniref:TetR/AcrR family transcriptional regulator n=1 Tax=unclassified Duganella TaxID=2636909 RepID=UPI00088CE68C|nr:MULTISPECIES: TetR/AcrR family transcriptional regulator [unclassified Duganella]SDG41178.1 transcriptional regulator, TetR family [Duganella sp. OV458]SDJ62819.1 transcriptional regulator, TetR family [Duganella sp. OV510]
MNKPSSTVEHIFNCTRNLIVSGGYNGFSYADISEVVGIRKASIHHHFPSKVDLVQMLLVRYRADAQNGMRNLEHINPAPMDQLRAYVGYWKTCIADGSAPFCICALLASELPILPEAVALEVRAYFRLLSQWLTSVLAGGQHQGVVALRHAPALEAEALMATVHGAMLSARAHGDATIFGMIVDSYLEGISVRA